MILGEADVTVPTTLGGVAVYALATIVWAYFREKRKDPRESAKAANLEEQTMLLRQIAAQNKRSGKKAAKAAKKNMKILKEVHGTVQDIRTDQQRKRKL